MIQSVFCFIKKEKEDVISDTALQNGERTRLVSPSMYSIAEFIEKINPKDEKNSKPLNDEDPIYAAAKADVPLKDKDGGHVVHHEIEEHEPKKENGALDKGASDIS